MKNVFKFGFIFLLISFFNFYCNKAKEIENTLNYDCANFSPSYTSDISVIINQSCAIVGCHNSTSRANGIDLSSYNLVKQAAGNANFLGSIRHLTNYIPMPRNGAKLSEDQIRIIYCWIQAGYLENSPTTQPNISSLNCSAAMTGASLINNSIITDAQVQVPYFGGNGTSYMSDNQPIYSTGVTGLKLQLNSGTLSNGAGNLTYTLNGTPADTGTANFSLNFYSKTCTISLRVLPKPVNNIITYSGTIMSILNGSCAIIGCHNSTTRANGLDLSSYNSVKQILMNDTVRLMGSIRQLSGFNPMPRGANKLADTTINKISTWIKSSYPQ